LAEAHKSKTAKAQVVTIVVYLTLERAVAHNLSSVFECWDWQATSAAGPHTGALHHSGVGRVFEVLRMGDGARFGVIEEVRAGMTATL
jgi:hypothetical protein